MSPVPAAREAIALVRAALDVPADRARVDDLGFTWRPSAFEQDVRAVAARDDGSCLVEASMPLLRGVRGRGPELAVLAAWNAREPGLSSLRWDSLDGSVWLRAAICARPGDGAAAARRLAHAALLQLGEAARAADALAVAFPDAALAESHDAATTPVPQSEAWRTYASEAAALAPGLGESVAALATRAGAPWSRATRAAHGVDAEIVCPAPPGGSRDPDVALLRVSATQPHPRLGAGVVLVMVPPPSAEPVAERAAATVALLQEGEAREWTGVDAIGGWCVHPAAGLSHVVFVPALAVEDDTVEELATQAVLRARWTMDFLADVRPRREGTSASPAPERP